MTAGGVGKAHSQGVRGVSWSERPARVRAPATSANLGPGFDALGLALALHDEVEARVTDGGLVIEVAGEGGGTAAAGERHLVVRAMRAAFGAIGEQPPGIARAARTRYPTGGGSARRRRRSARACWPPVRWPAPTGRGSRTRRYSSSR